MKGASKSDDTVSVSLSGYVDEYGEAHIKDEINLDGVQNSRFAYLRELNKLYNMECPEGAEEYELKAVLDVNKLELTDGKVIILEGLCGIKDYDEYEPEWRNRGLDRQSVQKHLSLHVSYIRQLIGESKIVIKESDSGAVYVWLLDYSIMEDLPVTQPSVSLLNETILTSGFTISKSDKDYKMLQKYGALEDIANNSKMGVWRKD